MAYIRFNDRGYECFDEGHYLLFSDGNLHESLFEYVAYDLSPLPKLLDKHVSRRMDTSTFTLRGGSDDSTAIDQIKTMLITAHPYYKDKARETLITAIGDYFNNLLLYSCYHQHTLDPSFSKKWYVEILTALLAPLLELGDTYPNAIYNKYQERATRDGYTVGLSASEIAAFVFGVPHEKPTGFDSEIRIQRKVCNMLYFLLDISAQGLDELSPLQRIWLYSRIMPNGGERVTASKQLPFTHLTSYRDGQGNSQAIERNCKMDDTFYMLQALGKFNVERDGIPTGMEEVFRSAIDYAKTVTPAKPYEEYTVASLYELLYLEIWSMLQDKVMIRKCRHCGKYFVVANRRIAYCDRVDASGMRCSAIGSQQAFKKKMETDEALQIYNRAYKTHHARVRKEIMSKEDFQLWAEKAKQKLAEVRAGDLDIVLFQEWLKK